MRDFPPCAVVRVARALTSDIGLRRPLRGWQAMRTIMILVLERLPMTRPYAPLRLLSALVVTVLALLGLTLPASASLAVPSDAGRTVTDRNHVSLSHLGVGPGASTKAGQGAGGGSGDGPAPDGGSVTDGGSASGPTVASASDPGVEAPADSGPAESTEPTEPAAGPAEPTTGPAESAESAGSTESDPAAVSEPATDPFTGDTPSPHGKEEHQKDPVTGRDMLYRTHVDAAHIYWDQATQSLKVGVIDGSTLRSNSDVVVRLGPTPTRRAARSHALSSPTPTP